MNQSIPFLKVSNGEELVTSGDQVYLMRSKISAKNDFLRCSSVAGISVELSVLTWHLIRPLAAD